MVIATTSARSDRAESRCRDLAPSRVAAGTGCDRHRLPGSEDVLSGTRRSGDEARARAGRPGCASRRPGGAAQRQSSRLPRGALRCRVTRRHPRATQRTPHRARGDVRAHRLGRNGSHPLRGPRAGGIGRRARRRYFPSRGRRRRPRRRRPRIRTAHRGCRRRTHRHPGGPRGTVFHHVHLRDHGKPEGGGAHPRRCHLRGAEPDPRPRHRLR